MKSGDRVGRERALLRAVLAGDARAWQTWYDECFDDLYVYVSWRCGGTRDLAEEVVQETWLVAVRRIGSFDPERAAFTGWLNGIAANVVRNCLRRRQRDRRLATATPDPDVLAAPSPDRELAMHVAFALAALPEHYEAVLRAKYLEQRTVAEIASERGETPKAVESLLTRARTAFREAYEKLEGDHVERPRA